MDVARVLPSISMILIVLLGISYWIKPGGVELSAHSLPFYLLTLSFLVLLPSILYSNNTDYLFQKLQIAIPYLVLPLAILKIPKLSKRSYLQIYGLYFLGILLICLFAFGNYLLNQEIINQLYLESKVMPTLVSHHPTLSLMIVFATYVAYNLFQKEEVIFLKKEKIIFFLGGIFLFIFMHVFSVRSGLLALYVILFLEIFRIAFHKKQFKQAIFAGLIIVLIGGITMFLSPTVSNKITNTTQDLSNYKNKGSANNQSLSSRLISYKNAFRIAQETSIWIGCGLGDIDDLNQEIFAKDYPDVSKPIDPHNQYLFYYAAIGILGLGIFLAGFYFPLLYKNAFQNRLLFVHYGIISIGFLFEAPMASQLGVAYSAIFILLPLQYLFGKDAVEADRI
ncbi:MAG: O-antigen ligase family protein [bacterium]|nr:O-antigen ligase family protein [bacterium]